MSDKALRKKQHILDTAKSVFSQKGFKDVTMKDIVDACEISRGGLYLYFSSTQEIMAEIIRLDKEAPDDVFAKRIKKQTLVSDVLNLFFKEQKKELLSKENNISIAIYEYLFSIHNNSAVVDDMKSEFNTTVAVFTHLIDEGVANGEFRCNNSKCAARNIVYALEGLKITAATIGVTEEEVDEELLYLMRGLVAEE